MSKSVGNMYDWVTHQWSCLIGSCCHDCHYCYVRSFWPETRKLYEGPCRFNPKDENINLGAGKKIFVAHTNDLFAHKVPHEAIDKVFSIVAKYPENQYIFQSKNPARVFERFMALGRERSWLDHTPKKSLIGTTIETDDILVVRRYSLAPDPNIRAWALREIKEVRPDIKTFVTIEPVLAFNLENFLNLVETANPDFVNIGADSKRHDLKEPCYGDVEALIDNIKALGIEVREKSNLERLKGVGQ